MTTIIGRKIWDTFDISADTRVTGWFKWLSNQENKTIKLDNFLLWVSWDLIDTNLILLLYVKYEHKNWKINTRIDAMAFVNFVKEHSKIKEVACSFMILHKDFQLVILNSWQLEVMDIRWTLFMWSGSQVWYWILNYSILKSIDVSLDDYYNTISSIDNNTWDLFTNETL